jgi:hypothetical protein
MDGRIDAIDGNNQMAETGQGGGSQFSLVSRHRQRGGMELVQAHISHVGEQ